MTLSLTLTQKDIVTQLNFGALSGTCPTTFGPNDNFPGAYYQYNMGTLLSVTNKFVKHNYFTKL